MTAGICAELAGLSEAEEFFEALAVEHEPRVLAAHRLQIMRAFGLAAASSLEANPGADASARRRALARALRAAHAAFAEESGSAACNPFAPGLVTLRRR